MEFTRAEPIGLVSFNYFYCTPSNGLVYADYYLSVNLGHTIPSGGKI